MKATPKFSLSCKNTSSPRGVHPSLPPSTTSTPPLRSVVMPARRAQYRDAGVVGGSEREGESYSWRGCISCRVENDLCLVFVSPCGGMCGVGVRSTASTPPLRSVVIPARRAQHSGALTNPQHVPRPLSVSKYVMHGIRLLVCSLPPLGPVTGCFDLPSAFQCSQLSPHCSKVEQHLKCHS